jgi:hypothetical protein
MNNRNEKTGYLFENKKAQVTIFIILAIIIVAVVGLLFVFRDNILQADLPPELEPVYEYYLSCIESEVMTGAAILGQQGGYIEPLEFEAGSEYMPFSNQLDFLGIPVSYWYYVSGNGIVKEQIPSRAKMQAELNLYVNEGLSLCNFNQFTEQGFEVIFEEATTSSVISPNEIVVDIKQDLTINFGNFTWTGKNHKVNADSLLGTFYDVAEKIYEKQKQTMFLENYGVDILRLYAPVDGTELGCATKLWPLNDIRENLTQALEGNVPAMKIKGDYYNLADKDNEYFVQDIGEDVDVSVNFMFVRDWPVKLEAWPEEDGILRADPVGLQEGLGVLGFCYVPYHFVYDFAYPVLIQLYSGSEMFQFPIVVFVEKNQPREAVHAVGLPDVVPELCTKKNAEVSVYTYDTSIDPIEAEIKFKCFDTECSIGKTESDGVDAVLIDNFPQCVNGFIIAKKEGYETEKYQISTTVENEAIIIMDKLYLLNLEVLKEGSEIESNDVVVSFSKGDGVTTLVYPEQDQVELSVGQYEIKVYVYSDSEINLKGSSNQKCVDVPGSGLLGIIGSTEKKCFDMVIPDQTVTNAVSGGGTENYYVGESELEGSSKLILDVENFGVPTKVEDLQVNYNNVEIKGVDVLFE